MCLTARIGQERLIDAEIYSKDIFRQGGSADQHCQNDESVDDPTGRRRPSFVGKHEDRRAEKGKTNRSVRLRRFISGERTGYPAYMPGPPAERDDSRDACKGRDESRVSCPCV